MAQDFAKSRRVAGGKKASARRKRPQRRSGGRQAPKTTGSGWHWYGAGVITGVFLSFLLYLGSLPTPDGAAPEQPGGPQAAQPPKPRFDFYTMLPGQTADVAVEPAPELVKPRSTDTTGDYYVLQTGSFRQREDADRRRAELLLLGLTPMVEETSGDNGRWYRVYVGPFESHSQMAKARSLTANQNIDTLLLKRSKP